MPQFLNQSQQPQRILIVDDHTIVRKGLALLINQDRSLSVCGEAEDAEVVPGLIEAQKPHLVILDISLKGASGLEMLAHIRAQYGSLPVLILSMHDSLIYVERALKAGANGYLMKHEGAENLVFAIQSVLQGETYLNEALRKKLLDTYFRHDQDKTASSVERLSPREFEILQLLGRGYGTRQIAGQLHLSIKTIESHREKIKEKLNLKNATELIQYATKWSVMESN
jgi:DNA-binding NarL/FixJ family response regulator